MHENFTSNSEAVYLANLTQSKKISYLEKQLANSQFYSRTIEQQLQGLRMTMSRILRERTNHQVMVRMYQTLFHLERRCKQMSDMLKQSNARNLIEMQMRIQEKSEYMEKTRDLEQELQFIRKNNRDKEQEFTIVVNKLRKYEDINELTLEDKLGRDSKNQLIILSEDKQELIRSMAEELNHYRKIYHHDKVDLDKKIAILEFAVQNRVSYETLMESYYESLKAPDRKSQAHRLLSSEVKVGRDSWKDRDKFSENMNENTRQLIKQIKKLVLSNKLLQAALNQCLEKNQQLALNNQILMDANLQLKRQLSQAHKHENSPIYRKTSPSHLYNSTLKPRQEQLHNADNFLSRASAKQTHLRSTDPATNVVRDDFFYQDRAASAGELARQRKLRNYLHNLKSTEYEVNVESLVKDVSNMSQLLVLNLGKASMNGQGNGTSYSVYLQREGREREVRSISADILKDRGKIKKVESILKQQQIAESYIQQF